MLHLLGSRRVRIDHKWHPSTRPQLDCCTGEAIAFLEDDFAYVVKLDSASAEIAGKKDDQAERELRGALRARGNNIEDIEHLLAAVRADPEEFSDRNNEFGRFARTILTDVGTCQVIVPYDAIQRVLSEFEINQAASATPSPELFALYCGTFQAANNDGRFQASHINLNRIGLVEVKDPERLMRKYPHIGPCKGCPRCLFGCDYDELHRAQKAHPAVEAWHEAWLADDDDYSDDEVVVGTPAWEAPIRWAPGLRVLRDEHGRSVWSSDDVEGHTLRRVATDIVFNAELVDKLGTKTSQRTGAMNNKGEDSDDDE